MEQTVDVGGEALSPSSWRIEANGTTYFDLSVDGGTWTQFASTANEFEALAVGVGAMVGTWDTESSTTSAIFDNFNVWHPVYTYDANGNLTSDGTKCYEYNEANQLSKVKECGNNHTIAEYVYDYTGLRTVKKNYVTGTLSNTVVSWSDGYETKTPLGGSALNTTYYWMNGELLSKKDNSGNRFYYHNDHLGSASLLTNSLGVVTEESMYDPWGAVKSGGDKSKFQYTGQEKDNETGLNYYNARYYSSDMRRFTQPDDIIQNVYNPQDLNRYAYVRNNPLRYTDPSGHFAIPLFSWARSVIVATLAYYTTPSGQSHLQNTITTVWNGANQLGSQINSGLSNLYKQAGSSSQQPTNKPPTSSSNTTPSRGSSGSVTPPSTNQSGLPPEMNKFDPIKWVKQNFSNPLKGPDGWKEKIYGNKPNDRTYHNPETKETLSPDLKHGPSKNPHWDYRDINKDWWRIFKDGTIEPK